MNNILFILVPFLLVLCMSFIIFKDYSKTKGDFISLLIKNINLIEKNKVLFLNKTLVAISSATFIFMILFYFELIGLNLTKKIITTIGLILDVIGILFIAYFVRKNSTAINLGAKRGKVKKISPIVERYENDSEETQKLAYIFIVIGFILQIISTWLY